MTLYSDDLEVSDVIGYEDGEAYVMYAMGHNRLCVCSCCVLCFRATTLVDGLCSLRSFDSANSIIHKMQSIDHVVVINGSSSGGAPLWQLHAHDKPTCALGWCTSPAAKGLLATGSTDKVVKLWDVSEGKPKLLASQDVQVGAVFTLGFCSDAPHLLAVGGAGGSVAVWDVRAAQAVAQRYPGLMPVKAENGDA